MTTTKLDSLNLPADLVTRLRTEVLYDDATLEAASFTDIRDLPPGLRILLRRAFPNLAEKPAASDAGSHAPAGRVNPLLAGITDRSDAIKAIVSKIAEGDRSPDMLSAARSLSISSVARLDGAVSVSATLSYLAHLAEGGSVRPSWKDHEIVDLAELVKKLRISPTNSGELEDGVDPRTGIDWSSKPDEMVARIRFAAQDGMLAGLSDAAIVTAYEGGDQHLVDRTKRRMKAAKADVESLLRGLRLSPPPVDPRPSTLTDADLQHRISKAAADLVERRVTKIDFLNKEFARDTDTDLLARRCDFASMSVAFCQLPKPRRFDGANSPECGD